MAGFSTSLAVISAEIFSVSTGLDCLSMSIFLVEVIVGTDTILVSLQEHTERDLADLGGPAAMGYTKRWKRAREGIA